MVEMKYVEAYQECEEQNRIAWNRRDFIRSFNLRPKI